MATRYYIPEEEKKAMNRAAGTAKLLTLPADIIGKGVNSLWELPGIVKTGKSWNQRQKDRLAKEAGPQGNFIGGIPQTKPRFDEPWKRATGVPETNVENQTANEFVTAGSVQHKLEVKNIEASLEEKSDSSLEEGNDGLAVNNEELERLTAEDQALASGEIQRETTFGPEGIEEIKISEGPGEPTDTPEIKDGPFATAADTFNTVNSMIKGLSTIMANMNPDAKSVAFADPTDYFKNKNALEDWRKKMYGSQVRA